MGREPAEGRAHEQRQDEVFLGQALLFFLQSVRASGDLRLIADAVDTGQFRLAEDHQVVGQTQKVRLHGFGSGGTRPCLGLTQLVLNLKAAMEMLAQRHKGEKTRGF